MKEEILVKQGVYTNAAGHVCRVIGLAYYTTKNTHLVVYEADFGKPDSRLMAEDVGEFISSLRRGNYQYHGLKYKKPKDRSLAGGFKPGSRVDKKA